MKFINKIYFLVALIIASTLTFVVCNTETSVSYTEDTNLAVTVPAQEIPSINL